MASTTVVVKFSEADFAEMERRATEKLLPAWNALLDERDLYRAALHAIDGTANRPPSEAPQTLVDCHMIASAALVSGKRREAAAREAIQ